MLRSTVTALSALMISLPALAADLPKPLTPDDFFATDPVEVALGRQLFFDPILSGNKNIACSTCHHPTLGTADGASLGIGEGGLGLGMKRVTSRNNHPTHRIPRNAPALWNLGTKDTKVMFHDGRLSVDPSQPYGIKMPNGFELERAVDSVLAAQALLPPTSDNEMAGQGDENDVAKAAHEKRIQGPNGVWAILAKRVDDIPEYRRNFDWVIGADQPVHMTDIGNAIAAYIAFEFRTTDSAFDRFLAGRQPLPEPAARGMEIFYGKGGCGTCHSGPNLTDQKFYAIGVPQIGPGKQAKHMKVADIGRGAVTGIGEDDYRFRTPSLRNIALTAPYGHSGAFSDLEDMVRHHLDPHESLATYSADKALLHKTAAKLDDDFEILGNISEMIRIAAATELKPVALNDAEVKDLMAFLNTLTDSQPMGHRMGLPTRVPSGLPVE